MRTALKLACVAAALSAAGCSSFKWDPYDPQAPETVSGRAEAAERRSAAEARCNAQGGSISQRDGTDGRSVGDWNCNLPRPK
jgi:putative hemolysin